MMGSRKYAPSRSSMLAAARRIGRPNDAAEGTPAHFGSGKPPCGRNELCPCGSNLKYKKCVKLGHKVRKPPEVSIDDLTARLVISDSVGK